MCESVVMLHGFGGTSRAFDGVIAALHHERYRPIPQRYRPIPLDLLGHASRSVRDSSATTARRKRAARGESPAASPSSITWGSCVKDILSTSPRRFLLCGYSQGGRIALQVALAAKERVTGLVLLSTTAGIEDERERERRAAADERLAVELETGALEDFVERWRTQPLFADEPPHVRALATQDMLRNDPISLAAAMRGLGTGRMTPLWNRLSELHMPAIVLAGERDEKYVALGRRLADALPKGELRVVPAGHGLLLERPDAVAASISDLLDATS